MSCTETTDRGSTSRPSIFALSLVGDSSPNRHGSGGGNSSRLTGSTLGGDPGPMKSRCGMESAFIPRSWRGFVQPRMGRQFLAWRQPQGIPNEPTIILSPRRGRRRNSRQGCRWCRVASADRDSQFSALGVGLPSGAPFRCKHRLMHRKGGPGQRGPKCSVFGVGRGIAIWGPFPVPAPDNAPETWNWSTRSEGGLQIARPQSRRKPDRVEVPNMFWTCGSLVW